jgi:perosamine synthetase
MKVPYTRPVIGQAEIDFVNDAVINGWGPDCYAYIERFEAEFAKKVGSRFAVATSSCTGALVLSLKALGVGPGDEVILSDANWVAAASAVMTVGAVPVMVDIEPDTWCLSPESVKQAISMRTKAIIVTHLYGNLANIEAILDIRESTGIPVVEDAAESLGSSRNGRFTGTFGDTGVFSFHGTKLITTGEGGMLVTNNEDTYRTVQTLNNHGREFESSKQFWSVVQGYKFKMSNIQAALGLGQLKGLEKKIDRKREIFSSYVKELEPVSHLIEMNIEKGGDVNSYWMPTVVFASSLGVGREEILATFRNAGIDARVFFWPLSSFPFLEGKPSNPIAADISSRAINLPSFEEITPQEIKMVSSVVLKLCTS